MRTWNRIALTLVIIGALNWLLIGLFNYDLVASIFGSMSAITRILYVLVGLSGIWALFTLVPMFSAAPRWQQAPSASM